MDIDDLILSGAIEPAGIDPETGEMLYNFTNKLEHIHPALNREVKNMFNSHIMTLWEKGIVSMNILDKDPVVKLTPKAFNPELISSLDEEVLQTLKEVKRHIITG